MGDEERAAKRPKRTYRACYPCRSRKLKCSFGDPNLPWDGPCERCLREQRECIRAKATFVRDAVPRKSDLAPAPPAPAPPVPPPARPSDHNRASFSSVGSGSGLAEGQSHGSLPPPGGHPQSRSHRAHSHSQAGPHGPVLRDDAAKAREDSSDEEEDQDDSDNALVSSSLQNPSDALKLLASASSLQYRGLGHQRTSKRDDAGCKASAAARRVNNTAIWTSWGPIRRGYLNSQDARALFSFYELEMAPLYPLIHPVLFEPHYLETLVKQESLLLGSMIVIAARYSNILNDNRCATVHNKLSHWMRLQLMAVIDGEPSLRTISAVEALLLLSEWPMVPMTAQTELDQPSDNSNPLKASLRYDAFSWTNIGMAVRLSQELGIQDAVNLQRIALAEGKSWKQHRMLKTWAYCMNAERHIAVRLGRNAVMQEAMTTQWWESVSDLVSHDNRDGRTDVHTSDVFILSCIAQLMGTIQDHLYPNKEVTRALLRTGAWEPFLRSFRLEIRYSKRSCQAKLSDGSLDSALLQIELDYVVLYANAIALRALQGKLRRRRQAGDVHYASPSLLNMVEGPWIMEALSAARSILDVTLNVLEAKRILRNCPSRIFQYILFATTFLYKALAAGMVEYGEHNIVGMVQRVVTALSSAAIDDQTFLCGFADLLHKLGKHWRERNTSNSPSVLARPMPQLRERDPGQDRFNGSGPGAGMGTGPNMSANAATTVADTSASPPTSRNTFAAPGGPTGQESRDSLNAELTHHTLLPTIANIMNRDATLATMPAFQLAMLQAPLRVSSDPGLSPPGMTIGSDNQAGVAGGANQHGFGAHSQSQGQHHRQPQDTPSSTNSGSGVGPGGINFTAGLPFNNDNDLNWNFDPTFQMPAAANEQDMLFQGLWDNTQQDNTASTANLYATLLGDVLLMEGQEAM